jgi:nucleotide-binding universal stress UspA family protein
MIERVMVAVDDSGPALAAADFAIEFVLTRPAELHVVTVREPGRDADALIRHVEAAAASSGVSVTTTVCEGGHPFDALLTAASRLDVDLIVMGRSDMRRPGAPYVGSQTEHLLEFTNIPVLVVPSPARASS